MSHVGKNQTKIMYSGQNKHKTNQKKYFKHVSIYVRLVDIIRRNVAPSPKSTKNDVLFDLYANSVMFRPNGVFCLLSSKVQTIPAIGY
jgi:hypothetical protein